ncbi:cholesterol oxidase [Thermomonospora umbrina]|uniref:Cholesterol oxidase n=1 Tax=Thermomonospora umbrina TaxID=111806 RepID=A0A3D9T5Y8_9ACTN|nr:cholesterol oxidase [Thermomonospora umbrina]
MDAIRSSAVTRREFAGLAGLALTPRSTAVREERHRVVIIGAGVGGAVAAFRFARAGVDNVVLERGRRWPITPAADTFPRVPSVDERLFWLDGGESTPASGVPVPPEVFGVLTPVTASARSTGLLDVVADDALTVVCGAGVGGGTLVYAGVLLQPPPEAFHLVFPPEVDYGELDRVHYPRARRRMVSAVLPDDLLAHPRYRSHHLWRSALASAERPVERLTVNYDIGILRAELTGGAEPAATVGQYVFTGCDSGAKMSVDRTYLARAEATGRTRVRPLHHVVDIAQNRDGTYRVTADRLAVGGAVIGRVVLHCDALVLAAGGVHTPRLLVTARDTGALPRLNESVGRGWGTNGDHAILIKTLAAATGAPQGGPPAFMVRNQEGTAVLMHAPLPLPVESGLLACLGMGIPDRLGRWTYDGSAARARLDWAPGSDATARRAVADLARQAARGVPLGAVVVEPFGARPLTVHPLGGAVIGEATDTYGRLHGYDRLYCLDAALLPGSAAAVNPALTIAALVERCLDRILREDFAR